MSMMCAVTRHVEMSRDGSSCIVVTGVIGGLSVFGKTFAKGTFVSPVFIIYYIFNILSYTEGWLN